jgi:enoyl-CoA hydratase/carnithine racemase
MENYLNAYRYVKLTRDAEGVLVVQLHDKGKALMFSAEAHTEVTDAFYRLAHDRGNKFVILTGAGGDFTIGVDWASFKDVSDPGVWSAVPARRNPSLQGAYFVLAARRAPGLWPDVGL